ncbi:hypothetical protein QR680_016106 [Steinernema hermaphroditum]|uniref:Uncharacterized protein n=1 Tax=Steinernema hermaphroditum TaxID=289476 RepID=A0AA39LLS2_9BILA|nr:hypothetical protein QR680_016106 [Steinernema hermaphroditum]
MASSNRSSGAFETQPLLQPLNELQGILFVAVVVISLPLNFRIIYIFVSRPAYRSLECYRIMTHIGLAQCLIAPGVLFQGVLKLIAYDPLNLASIAVMAFPPISRAEAILQLVLALNRLKIICQLRYSSTFHTILLVVAWTFGILFYASYFAFSSSYSISVSITEMLPTYDLSKPLSAVVRKLATTFYVVMSSATLAIYVVIIIYILY